MLAFAHQYPHWTDFPNGLRVLVVDTDTQLLAHLKSKLEAFNYEATTFSTSGEAVVALQNRSSVFHAALVEASAENNGDGWKVLEAATHLPVIMMSSIENMDIMMKSLACGACEFLQKPLSDETLKNIWQHVVRKALCTGELLLPDNIWPAKDVELSPPEVDISETNKTEPPTRRNLDPSVKVKVELPAVDDEEPANLFIHEDESSTLFDITSGSVGDCYFPCERFLDSPAKLELDHRVETPASQENASNQSPGLHDLISVKAEINGAPHEFPEYDHLFEIKSKPEDASDGSSADVCGFLGTNMDEDDDKDPLKSKGGSNLQLDEELELDDSLGGIKISNEFVKEGNNTSVSTSCLDGSSVSEGQGLIGIDGLDRNCVDEEAGLLQEVKRAERNLARNTSDIITMSPDTYKATYSDPQERGKTSKVEGKRKLKVDWTPELHRRFVQAVEQLGVDKAIPSRILEIMGVQCLTRHNIASHLQKYRSHRKHVLVREAEVASWNQRRRSESSPWSSRPRLPPPPPPYHASIAPSMQCRSPLIPIQPHLAPHGHTIAPPPPLHVWGHPSVDHCQIHMWHKPLVATTAWQTSNGTFWQQTCIDTWAHSTAAPRMLCYAQDPMQNLPLMPMPGVAHMTIPVLLGESITGSINEMESTSMNGKLTTSHSAKEMVNAAINEVLANPDTPLPLGLKPPSLESVIHELQRQSLYTSPS